MIIDFDAIGYAHTHQSLKATSLLLQNARPAYESIHGILEEGEQRLFKRLGGKYVDTGALMASLTQPTANNAIRETHAQGLDFGTSLYYARFHTDKRGKSAVLKLQPTEQKKAGRTLLEYVTSAFGIKT